MERFWQILVGRDIFSRHLRCVRLMERRSCLTRTRLAGRKNLKPGRSPSNVCETRTQTKIYLVFRGRHFGYEVLESEHQGRSKSTAYKPMIIGV